MSELKLDKDTKSRLALKIRRYLDEELDAEIGNMEAEFFLEFLEKALGPCFYNQGLRDAQALVSRRMADLTDDFYALEKPEDPVTSR